MRCNDRDNTKRLWGLISIMCPAKKYDWVFCSFKKAYCEKIVKVFIILTMIIETKMIIIRVVVIIVTIIIMTVTMIMIIIILMTIMVTILVISVVQHY